MLAWWQAWEAGREEQAEGWSSGGKAGRGEGAGGGRKSEKREATR